MNEVKVNLLPYSQHKFASNVVEKCLQVPLCSQCAPVETLSSYALALHILHAHGC